MSDRPIRTRSQYKLAKKLQEKLANESLATAEMIEDANNTAQQSPMASQIDLTNATVTINDSYSNSGPAVFFNEQAAVIERENCDYSIHISLEMAKKGNLPRKIRILAHGVYDLFHVGHAHQLMQAKNMFSNTYLIVGVFNDQVTREERGQTVLNELERYECVRHCRYVDEIIPNLPSTIDDAFLTEHKIDFIAQPAPVHEFDKPIDIFLHVKNRDMFVPIERTEGISTSEIICRLVRDYDMYIRRNLARGYSSQDLNVGFLKRKQLDFQSAIDKIKEKFNNYEDESKIILERWEDRSKEYIRNFISLFASNQMFHLFQRTLPSSRSDHDNDDLNRHHSRF